MENKLKFFNKPSKDKMILLIIVFVWIAIWNVIYQTIGHAYPAFEEVIISWPFFLCFTIFFMQEELTMGQRFWSTLLGGSVGIITAALFIPLVGVLTTHCGFSPVAAICAMILFDVALLIMLMPVMPYLFNNVGFVYFLVALINPAGISLTDAAGALAPKAMLLYLLSLAAGSVILNLGIIGIFAGYKKIRISMAKK